MTFISMNKREQLFSGLYLVFQLLFLPVIVFAIPRFLPFPLNDAQQNFLFFSINLAATVLICRKYLLRSLKAAAQAPGRLAATVLLALCLYQLGSTTVGYLIWQLMPDFFNVNDSNLITMAGSDYWIIAIGTVLMAPLTEEILYRGLLFGGLYRRSRLLAYLLSTIVFSLVHVTGYIGMYPAAQLLLCVLQYVPAGLCLAWIYDRTGTVLAPVLLHMIINAIGIAAMR
jgi:membrane protease YdiL (CAAX protease family)